MPELVFSSLKSIEAIPKMKQDLVSEYTLMQHGQQQFFKRLCIFSISSLAVLLITLFADVNNDQRWFVADILLALLAAINAWKLRK